MVTFLYKSENAFKSDILIVLKNKTKVRVSDE